MKRQLFVLALMGLSPSLMWAQTQDTLKARALEEVSVTAVRASADAPIAQVTVGLKTINENFNGQDGAFLLERLTPSLVSYSESGTSFSNYGQMRLRGIDQTRINITLNGVPLNDMIDQGVFFSNFTDFGNSIQSVQIQRGVGTSSNGVASYAGSVNFQSLSLLQEGPSAEVQFTGGSFNTARASAEVHSGLQENRTAFYARMSRLQSDGYRDHSGTESNSLFFSGGYFGEKQSLKFTGFAGNTKNDLAYSPVSISLIEDNPRTNVLMENDIDDFSQYLFQLEHTWRLSSNSAWSNTLYYGGAGGDFPFSYVDSSTATNLTTINYPLNNQHTGWLSNFSYQSNLGLFNLGLHAYTFVRENIEYVEPNNLDPYYEDQSTKDEFSAFLKWEKSFGPLKLFADLQVRQVQLALGGDADFLGEDPNIPVRDYFFVNPKAGISYNIRSKGQVYASFGRSGREPTRTDILGSLQVNASNIGDIRNVNSVEAEFVNDLELGTRWQWDALKLDANLFYMTFENEIAPIGVYIPEGFYQVYLNQESSFRRGLELMLTYPFMKRFEIQAQGAYLDAQISQYAPANQEIVYRDISPILSPKFNASLQFTYRPISSVRLAWRGRYLSEQAMELSDDPLMVPSSFILDFMADWNFIGDHVLSLQINNLSDELYYTYGAPDFNGGPAFLVQAPINIYGSVRFVF